MKCDGCGKDAHRLFESAGRWVCRCCFCFPASRFFFYGDLHGATKTLTKAHADDIKHRNLVMDPATHAHLGVERIKHTIYFTGGIK